jgi:hypothetical protein
MALWLLHPKKPWGEWDVVNGFVVRAGSEAQARGIAQARAGDEKWWGHSGVKEAWLCPDTTTCERLSANGDPGVILRDFQGG